MLASTRNLVAFVCLVLITILVCLPAPPAAAQTPPSSSIRPSELPDVKAVRKAADEAKANLERMKAEARALNVQNWAKVAAGVAACKEILKFEDEAKKVATELEQERRLQRELAADLPIQRETAPLTGPPSFGDLPHARTAVVLRGRPASRDDRRPVSLADQCQTFVKKYGKKTPEARK